MTSVVWSLAGFVALAWLLFDSLDREWRRNSWHNMALAGERSAAATRKLSALIVELQVDTTAYVAALTAAAERLRETERRERDTD